VPVAKVRAERCGDCRVEYSYGLIMEVVQKVGRGELVTAVVM